MTLDFRKNWNRANAAFADAALIPLLNPDEDMIRTVVAEAHLNGAFTDPAIVRMLTAAASPRGPIVSVRAGAHQIEDQGDDGFTMHIGTLFEGVNWHLNIGQASSGRLYVTSISRNAPRSADYFIEARTGAVPRR